MSLHFIKLYKKNKIYKLSIADYVSSLRAVSIFPGDLCGRRMILIKSKFYKPNNLEKGIGRDAEFMHPGNLKRLPEDIHFSRGGIT